MHDEIKLIKQRVDMLRPAIYIPLIFLGFALEVIRAISDGDCFEVRQKAGIDAALISRSTALSEMRSIVSCQDMKAGIYASILKNARCDDTSGVAKKIDKKYCCVAEYIQKNINEVNLSRIVQYFHAARGAPFEWSAVTIKKIITGAKSPFAPDELARLARWITEHESIQHYRLYEVMAEYLRAYDGSCTQNMS